MRPSAPSVRAVAKPRVLCVSPHDHLSDHLRHLSFVHCPLVSQETLTFHHCSPSLDPTASWTKTDFLKCSTATKTG